MAAQPLGEDDAARRIATVFGKGGVRFETAAFQKGGYAPPSARHGDTKARAGYNRGAPRFRGRVYREAVGGGERGEPLISTRAGESSRCAFGAGGGIFARDREDPAPTVGANAAIPRRGL